MGLWQRDLCKGLTWGVNTGEVTDSSLERTQLIIQPSKCLCLRAGDLNADRMGTFPHPADEPPLVPWAYQQGLWLHKQFLRCVDVGRDSRGGGQP